MSFNPITAPTEYVLVAGERTPGVAQVVIPSGTPRRWDERRGYAFSGATLRYRGRGLARFVIRIELYTAEHWDAWHAFRPVLQPPALGDRGRHLDVWHPILEDHQISALAVEDVGGPEEIDERGVWQIEIKCIEHRAPQFALSTPAGAATRVRDGNLDAQIEGQLDAAIADVERLL